MRPSPHSMMGSDSSALDGVRLPRGLVRRVWAFSGKYHRRVGWFLLIIVVEALLGLIPPLLIRQLVDHTIPDKNTAQVTVLGSIMIGAAFANAGLSLAERWLSSVIGEGLDLRPACRSVRSRAADADRVLHADPDRLADQPYEQRCDRRAAGRHADARAGGVEHRRAPHDPDRDGPAPVAAHADLAGPVADLRHPGQARRAAAPDDHPRGLQPQRVDEHDDDRAVQCVRCPAGQAVRPSARRVRRLHGPGRKGPRHRRAQRDVRPGLPHVAHARRSGRNALSSI